MEESEMKWLVALFIFFFGIICFIVVYGTWAASSSNLDNWKKASIECGTLFQGEAIVYTDEYKTLIKDGTRRLHFAGNSCHIKYLEE